MNMLRLQEAPTPSPKLLAMFEWTAFRDPSIIDTETCLAVVVVCG